MPSCYIYAFISFFFFILDSLASSESGCSGVEIYDDKDTGIFAWLSTDLKYICCCCPEHRKC